MMGGAEGKKWPGTDAETKFAEYLVRTAGAYFVTVVRRGVGEMLGIRIPGQTFVVKELMEAASGSALSAQVQDVAGWQSMDSAPRNPEGTKGHRGDLDIDLWHKRQGRLADCFWYAEHSAWFSRSGGRAFNMGKDDAFLGWMPKPAAPAAKQPSP